MAIYHIVTSINGLLRNYPAKKLGKLFDMDGKEAKAQLIEKRDRGEIYLQSDGCTFFDPKIGCLCDKQEPNTPSTGTETPQH